MYYRFSYRNSAVQEVNFSMVFTKAEQAKFKLAGCLWVFRVPKIHPLIKSINMAIKRYLTSAPQMRKTDLKICRL